MKTISVELPEDAFWHFKILIEAEIAKLNSFNETIIGIGREPMFLEAIESLKLQLKAFDDALEGAL
jgi:hypothetical protein